MEDERIVIILPLPNKALSPNWTVGSIGGRMMKAAAVKKYRHLVRDRIEQETIESLPWGKVLVSAAFFYATKRRRDPDNAMGSLKAAYDGIVDAGVVVDDDFEHMSRAEPSICFDASCPMVILTIERLE